MNVTPNKILTDQFGKFWLQGNECEIVFLQWSYCVIFLLGDDIRRNNLAMF